MRSLDLKPCSHWVSALTLLNQSQYWRLVWIGHQSYSGFFPIHVLLKMCPNVAAPHHLQKTQFTLSSQCLKQVHFARILFANKETEMEKYFLPYQMQILKKIWISTWLYHNFFSVLKDKLRFHFFPVSYFSTPILCWCWKYRLLL